MSEELSGKVVLVTRAKAQSEELTTGLEALGASVIALPAIEIVEPLDWGAADEALVDLARFDWVVLTSSNAVAAILNRLKALGLDAAVLAGRSLAAVGASTARTLERRLRAPDAVPLQYVAEQIPECLGELVGKRILLPQADLARPNLAEALTAAGATVTAVTVYRILRSTTQVDLPNTPPDYVIFMSPESARSVADILKRAARLRWLRDAAIICIGPVTAQAVRDLGYEVSAVPRQFTAEGVVRTILTTNREDAAHV